MRISTNEVHSMLLAHKDISIVDVRNNIDYEKCHIEKAINIPIDILCFEAEDIIINKSKYIVVYANNDDECVQAEDTLFNLGYSNVFHIGAITKWQYEYSS